MGSRALVTGQLVVALIMARHYKLYSACVERAGDGELHDLQPANRTYNVEPSEATYYSRYLQVLPMMLRDPSGFALFPSRELGSAESYARGFLTEMRVL